MILASTGPLGVSQVVRPAAAEMGADRGVQVVAGHLERRGVGGVGGLVHVLHVVRVGGVLDDHLRVHLDPVEHPGVRVQRVVLVGFQLGQHRRLPVRRAAVPLVPDQDEAVPLHASGRCGCGRCSCSRSCCTGSAHWCRRPATASRARGRRCSRLPPCRRRPCWRRGAGSRRPAHAPGRTAVRNMHQFLTEVVRALDFDRRPGRMPKADDEPARREAVGRQRNAGDPNSRSDGSSLESEAESEIVCVTSSPYSHAAERNWAALNSPRFDD